MAAGMLLANSMANSVTQVLIWGGVLILAVVFLFGGLWYYRRWWLRGDEPSGDTAWTLDDLRRLRAEGQITEEEYQALRAAMTAAFRGDKGQSEADKVEPDFDLRNGPPG